MFHFIFNGSFYSFSPTPSTHSPLVRCGDRSISWSRSNPYPTAYKVASAEKSACRYSLPSKLRIRGGRIDDAFWTTLQRHVWKLDRDGKALPSLVSQLFNELAQPSLGWCPQRWRAWKWGTSYIIVNDSYFKALGTRKHKNRTLMNFGGLVFGCNETDVCNYIPPSAAFFEI